MWRNLSLKSTFVGEILWLNLNITNVLFGFNGKIILQKNHLDFVHRMTAKRAKNNENIIFAFY